MEKTIGKFCIPEIKKIKEFRNILLGQRIKVFTDHKNLVHESELKTSQRVMRWRLLLEGYGPEIEYIKGPKNVVADALSRLPKQGDIVDTSPPLGRYYLVQNIN